MDLCPWADMVYGCDPAWWKFRHGLPEYNGLKAAWSGAPVEYPGLLRLEIARHKGAFVDDMVFDRVGCVGGGGNSGFQVLNLVAQLRASRVVLIGFDMTDRGGVHWYGRNNWPMANNPTDANFRRWIRAMERAAPVLADRGVEVVNTAPFSALQAYRKASLDDLLDEWGIP